MKRCASMQIHIENALRLYEQWEGAKIMSNNVIYNRTVAERSFEPYGLRYEVAPALEQFRFEKNDCRSLFDPIDYVIFEGLHKTGKVQKIIFTDIKSGSANLKARQKSIKKLVQEKKLEFKTYKP